MRARGRFSSTHHRPDPEAALNPKRWRPAFLLSDVAGNITGVTYVIDGGTIKTV